MTKTLLAHLEAAVAPFQRDRLSVILSGSPVVRDSYLQVLKQDFLLLAPIGLLILSFVLGWTFRHWTAPVSGLCVVAVAQVWMFGLMVPLGLKLTLLSPMLPVIVVVAGSSDAVHLLTRHAAALSVQQVRDGGPATVDWYDAALSNALAVLGRSLLLTSLTTMLGFLALGVTSIPMLGEFGLAAAIGVGCAYVSTLTVLPALLTLLRPVLRIPSLSLLSLWSGPVGRWLQHPRQVIAVIIGVPVLLVAAGFPLLTVESQVIDDVSTGHPIRLRRLAVEQALGGNFPMTLMIRPRPPAGTSDQGPVPLELLWAVREFQEQLAHDSNGYVSSIVSVVDVYSFFWRGLEKPGPLPVTALDSRRLAALVGKQRLSAWMDLDTGEMRLELQVYDRGTRATKEFSQLARRLFQETVGPGAKLEIQGFVHLAHQVHRAVASNALKGFATSFLLVTLILAAALRSWRIALLATAPNLVPLMVVLGSMGLLGVELRVSTCIVFASVFGIAVDDTVHFLAEFRYHRQAPVRRRVELSLQGAGRGMVVTSSVLGLGFLALLLGQFHPSQVIGALVALTIASALISDLLLLPALLIVFEDGKASRAND